MIPFPNKKYDVIYADPAWKYENGMGIKSAKDGSMVSAELHYDTMTMNDLAELPVSDIADVDCLLFMWVLSPLIQECIEIGNQWGFDYKTFAFMWHKRNTHLGHYTMSECELCAVFKRKGGKIPKPRGDRGVKQFLETQFISALRSKHSVKPLEIQHRITEMFPTQAKIELFARPMEMTKIDGWDYWGDEV